VHASIDLPASQTLDRRLIEGTVLSERRDERGTNACKWSAHILVSRQTFKTSCIEYQPERPCTHRAASNAPAAQPRRSRARWINSIVSDALSNPTVRAGIIPALADDMSIARREIGQKASAVEKSIATSAHSPVPGRRGRRSSRLSRIGERRSE
jgi:hypothetical protein